MSSLKLCLAATALLFSLPLYAQWLSEPTRGIPRTPEGKADLSAPAPRTAEGHPDFTGLWLAPFHPGYVINVATDLDPADVQPWAAKVFNERLDNLGKDDPGTIGCQPLGPRHITGGALVRMSKIVQTPAVIVVMYEDLNYRQIFLDGRALPKNPSPSFMGYSIGRWEGDELVVESTGFKDTTWLDFGGHPHSEQLRITERYRRTDFGHIRRQITLSDPEAFTKPIVVGSDMTLNPDTELLEYVCAETPRERFHLVGRSEAEKKVRVPVATLDKYVGDYDFAGNNTFGIRTATVTRSGAQLFIDFNGKGRTPLVPLSQNMFSPRLLGTYEFVSDEHGVVTHIMVHGVESSEKAVRRRKGA
ncbi:MAG TPA: hypothetical protein VJS12_18175 [Steroidobacteraceae bacterium]|nr:hypothetical protein [Steroidobacteraceae bacterium]